MLTLLAIVIALVALGGVASLGAAARTRDQELADAASASRAWRLVPSLGA